MIWYRQLLIALSLQPLHDLAQRILALTLEVFVF
jgi:hypothetical protein